MHANHRGVHHNSATSLNATIDDLAILRLADGRIVDRTKLPFDSIVGIRDYGIPSLLCEARLLGMIAWDFGHLVIRCPLGFLDERDRELRILRRNLTPTRLGLSAIDKNSKDQGFAEVTHSLMLLLVILVVRDAEHR